MICYAVVPRLVPQNADLCVAPIEEFKPSRLATFGFALKSTERSASITFVTDYNRNSDFHVSRSRLSKKLLSLLAIGLMGAAIFVAAPTTPQRASAQTVNPEVTWSANGAFVQVNGGANLSRFGCGVLHCSTTTGAVGRTVRTGGTATPNSYRVKIKADQPVVTGTVSIGSGGASVGATVSGTSCTSGTYTSASGFNYVTITPGGEFCTARGASALSLTYQVSGDFRVGSSWSSNSSSRTGG